MLAIAASALFWLAGMVAAIRGGIRNQQAHRKDTGRRRTIVVMTGLHVFLWTVTCLLLRPLVVFVMARELAAELSERFAFNGLSALLLADIALVTGWGLGLLLTGGFATVIWRWGGSRSPDTEQASLATTAS